MRSYRLVVCLDVEADCLKEAYGRVYQALGKLGEGFDWESSDEAYDPDGNAISEQELSGARTEFLDTHTLNFDDGRCPHGMFFTGAGACPACEAKEPA